MTAEAEGSRWVVLARSKLHRLCGRERGEALLDEALLGAGLDAIRTVEDLDRVADQLIRKGGFVEAVGYALRFQATLHGARRAG
jgi:aryl carrier-like protein